MPHPRSSGPANVPTLTDGVVTLRKHSEDDVDGSWEQCVDPLSVEWTTVPVPYTRDDAKRFVRHAMPGGWETDQEWGFAVEYDGQYGGTISLRNQGDGRAEIAYGSHPAVRGVHVDGPDGSRSVMERALRLLLEWGFASSTHGGRQLHTVIWWANQGNWASRRLAWRLGFDIAPGTVRHWLPQRGELRDAWVGTLLRDDERMPRHRWLDTPVIEMEALRLRPLRSGDDPRVVQACGDAVAQQWLAALPSPYQLSDARWWREDCQRRAALGETVTWAVADPADDRIIGAINLFGMAGSGSGPGRARQAEIGYWVHPEARGRGVATAATRAALRHAFVPEEDGGLGLTRVFALAAVDNAPSRTVLTGAGMSESGLDHAALILRTGPSDAVRYEIVDLGPVAR